MKSLLEPVYRAVESGDIGGLQESMCNDVFMFTPEAAGVLTSREAVVAYARHRLGLLRASGTILALHVGSSKSGTDPSGRGAWVFDQVDVNIARLGVDMQAKVRVTALLKRELDRWRIAACYWSLPFATQAEQDAVKHAGQLEPGLPLEEVITDEAQPLAAALTGALKEPPLLPELYSTSEDHGTIGSVIDEVFVGPAGRAAWEEFVGYVSDYTLRGSLRAALATNDLGWLAANIDVGRPPTPYRFFYIWLRETDTWRIVISHDAVSRLLTSDLGGCSPIAPSHAIADPQVPTSLARSRMRWSSRPPGRTIGTQPVRSPSLAVGRHPCWNPQHHVPRSATQFRGDPGSGWL